MKTMGLSLLAAVTGIIVLIPIPGMAHATTAQQAMEGSPKTQSLKVGTSILQQGSMSFFTPYGELKCSGIDLVGKLTANGGSDIASQITESLPQGCAYGGQLTDVILNAGYQGPPWAMQVQQPEMSGQIVTHIEPGSGGSLKFGQQIQISGISLGTCFYEAEELELMGTEASNEWALVGKEQFVLISGGPGLCGEAVTAAGSFLFTSEGAAVTVDMT